jgi:hypothetical protein
VSSMDYGTTMRHMDCYFLATYKKVKYKRWDVAHDAKCAVIISYFELCLVTTMVCLSRSLSWTLLTLTDVFIASGNYEIDITVR